MEKGLWWDHQMIKILGSITVFRYMGREVHWIISKKAAFDASLIRGVKRPGSLSVCDMTDLYQEMLNMSNIIGRPKDEVIK